MIDINCSKVTNLGYKIFILLHLHNFSSHLDVLEVNILSVVNVDKNKQNVYISSLRYRQMHVVHAETFV